MLNMCVLAADNVATGEGEGGNNERKSNRISSLTPPFQPQQQQLDNLLFTLPDTDSPS